MNNYARSGKIPEDQLFKFWIKDGLRIAKNELARVEDATVKCEPSHKKWLESLAEIRRDVVKIWENRLRSIESSENP